ncbi:hypothetical protein NIES2119_23175 [[Phormidium ambiguum] IAM M-71]|uniref:Uncharacterized protein n=1 Tax=[Phormidium ambiguum] IAM M-71 TaxID=454136 RepID=A0A1U7IA89_9CYAN|nr:hypothetical protein [Phormidium ambiguum]OKH33482.1 hypothetical protein NIES2119_23175 [Phormidium ambiguum IAM M-71]
MNKLPELLVWRTVVYAEKLSVSNPPLTMEAALATFTAVPPASNVAQLVAIDNFIMLETAIKNNG